MSDGQSVLLYIAKNNKPNSDGDYGWSKSVPLDKNYHAKVAYEYQLDFNKKSFDNLKTWLKKTLGEENVFGVAFDFKNAEKGLYETPASWYNNDMSLTDVYNYCKNTNDSTIMIWGRRDLQSQLISIIFNPDVNEMTILYTFLNN